MKKTIAIGVDIGGSHISCSAVDLESLEIIGETRSEKSIDNKAEAAIIIEDWAGALSSVLNKISSDKLKGIGFGMVGPCDYVNGISYIKGVAKYEKLYGCNIRAEILEHLSLPAEYPVRFINDVYAFAIGESVAGIASKAEKSVFITLGTGLGSAFISRRIPVVDSNDVPKLGTVYHLPYGDGIADDYFSTRWFLGRYREATGRQLSGVKEFAKLAGSDKIVADLFTEFGVKLGVFLAPWIKRFGAEIVVVGGNISNSYDNFGNIFEESLKNEGCNCPVELSVLKEDAAIIGSAYLLDEKYWSNVQHVLPLM